MTLQTSENSRQRLRTVALGGFAALLAWAAFVLLLAPDEDRSRPPSPNMGQQPDAPPKAPPEAPGSPPESEPGQGQGSDDVRAPEAAPVGSGALAMPSPVSPLLRVGREAQLLQGSVVMKLSFTADGQGLWSAGFNGWVRCWSVPECEPLQSWQAHTTKTASFDHSPAARLLVTVGEPDALKVWSYEGQLLLEVPLQREPWEVALSPDGARAAVLFSAKAVGDQDLCELLVYDLSTGQRVSQHFLPSEAEYGGLVFGPHGLVFHCAEGSLRSLDSKTGRPAMAYPAEAAPSVSFSLSQDHQTLAVVGQDLEPKEEQSPYTVVLWKVGSPTPFQTLRPRSAYGPELSTAVLVPGGRRLLVQREEAVELWDVPSCEVRGSFPTKRAGSLAVNAQATYAAWSGGGLGQVRLLDLSTVKPVLQHADPPKAHTDRIVSTAFSPTAKEFLSASDDGTVRRWSVPEGRCLATYVTHAPEASLVSYTPDGRGFATGGADSLVALWTLDSQTPVLTFGPPETRARALAFSPDGHLLATSFTFFGGEVELWEAATGRFLGALECGEGGVHTLRFSPSGQQLLVAGSLGTLEIWDVAQARRLEEWSQDTVKVRDARFDSAGTRVAVADLGGRVRVLRFPGGQVLLSFEAHPRTRGVHWLPTGRLLTHGGPQDATLVLWEKGAALARFGGWPGRRPYSVAVSPDGRYAVAGGYGDNAIALWDLTQR